MPEGWSPTADPYIPLQSYFADNPWRVVAICILLGMTSRRAVGPLVDGLFARWPSPSAMATADADELREYLRSLGLTERRPRALIEMSIAWIAHWGDGGWPLNDEQIAWLPHCGTYASEAVAMFCFGRDIEPRDRVLAEWARRKDGIRDDL